jgi:hypothetical protein
MRATDLILPTDESGHCPEPCEHVDCAALRLYVAAPCGYCGEALGYCGTIWLLDGDHGSLPIDARTVSDEDGRSVVPAHEDCFKDAES